MLNLAGMVESVAVLDGWAGHALGVVLYGLGLATTVYSADGLGCGRGVISLLGGDAVHHGHDGHVLR